MDARTLADGMGNALPLSKYQELLPAHLNAARAAGMRPGVDPVSFVSAVTIEK